MGKEPRPFTVTLTAAEAAEITGAAGEGGHQEMHRRLTNQLQNGNLTVEFNDEQLGALIRYMTQYGSGGFQGRLKRAFVRSIQEILAR